MQRKRSTDKNTVTYQAGIMVLFSCRQFLVAKSDMVDALSWLGCAIKGMQFICLTCLSQDVHYYCRRTGHSPYSYLLKDNNDTNRADTCPCVCSSRVNQCSAPRGSVRKFDGDFRNGGLAYPCPTSPSCDYV